MSGALYSEKSSADATANPGSNIQMEGIKHPGINDVMFGRGGDTNYHIGNHRFRVLADEHRYAYRSASRKEKQAVVQEVVGLWRDRGGRFLAKTNPEKGDDSLWNDVGDTVAKKKAAKILSEKVPEAKNKEGRGNGRKRAPVDSIGEDRAVKRPAVSQQAPAVSQAALATSTVATGPAAGGATLFSNVPPARPSAATAASASLLQQPAPAPVQQPPLQLGSFALQATLRQLLQVPGGEPRDGALGSAQTGSLGPAALGPNLGSLAILRELLGIRNDPPAAPTLSSFTGLDPADIDLARLALTAQLSAREQSSVRAKSLLSNGVLGDLRVLGDLPQLLPARPNVDTNSVLAAALIGALRLRLDNDLANNWNNNGRNQPGH